MLPPEDEKDIHEADTQPLEALEPPPKGSKAPYAYAGTIVLAVAALLLATQKKEGPPLHTLLAPAPQPLVEQGTNSGESPEVMSDLSLYQQVKQEMDEFVEEIQRLYPRQIQDDRPGFWFSAELENSPDKHPLFRRIFQVTYDDVQRRIGLYRDTLHVVYYDQQEELTQSFAVEFVDLSKFPPTFQRRIRRGETASFFQEAMNTQMYWEKVQRPFFKGMKTKNIPEAVENGTAIPMIYEYDFQHKTQEGEVRYRAPREGEFAEKMIQIREHIKDARVAFAQWMLDRRANP